MSDNPFRVVFRKKGRPYWIPPTQESPGEWAEQFPVVNIHFPGVYLVVPELENKRKLAVNHAIDRCIQWLEDCKV